MTFKRFFQGLHGYPPFPWQQRLADTIEQGKWPDALSLPTGVGKTSIIDIWAWAVEKGLNVPTRLFYIIDRRLVVDSVADQAELLAKHTGIISAKMRGGMLLDDTWVKDPTKPALIVSTIDQAGSRLLFRGYGVSNKVCPIHAALVANDALLVIDEAHLSPEFINTLKTIRDRHDADIRLVEMTATPANEAETFKLGDDDYAHPLLKKRLEKPKPTVLLKASSDTLVHETVKQALLHREQGADVIGVVINRVRDARVVFERLNKGANAVLLTGRIRDYDRQAILDKHLSNMVSGSRKKGRAPLYVVATQTIEVGADLDFDALVTESTDLSGLKQRFGRLNRLGELNSAPATIIHRELKSKDYEYKKEIASTWKWLNKAAKKIKKVKVIDFGICSLASLEQPEPLKPECPVLTPTHVKAIVHTSPPVPIDIHPFLHGWENNRDISIVWRADLDEQDLEPWEATCEAVPPVVGEVLQVPIFEAVSWLRQRPYYNRKTEAVTRLQPLVGDVLIVPASYGGCDEYGWNPGFHGTVPDLADKPNEKRLRLRLSATIYPEIVNIPEWNDPDNWKTTAKSLGCDERLLKLGAVQKYPAGLIVNAGLWSVQPVKTHRSIPLVDHLDAVGNLARVYAEKIGLSTELIHTLQMAAKEHDSGKSDPGFQLMIGGSPNNLLAKGSGGDDYYVPKGWRHEMLSASRSDHSLLTRYIVGSHHGNGRGVFPASPDLDLWRDLGGLGWGADFYALVEEHGAWRLAFFEVMVRLADWKVSEEEQA